MVLRFLLDTNVAIGLLDGHAPAQAVVKRHPAVPAETAISQITRMELLGFPGITNTEQKRIDRFSPPSRSFCWMN